MSVPNDPLENTLDLSALQSLSFGPNWATSSTPRPPSAPRDYSAPREDSRRGGGSGDGFRHDRRPDRRGSGYSARPPSGGGTGGGFGGQSSGEQRPARRFDGPRPARRDDAGGGQGFARGPRREHRDNDRFSERDREDSRRGDFSRRQPRPSPVADIVFFPEEKPFNVLTKAIKSSLRTYELFEIAKLILEKNDRFVVGCRPFDTEDNKEARLFQSIPDHLPFLSESDAVAHVMQKYLDLFFTQETIAVEPPKGNFLMVSKCGFTGEILGPPNYHGYQQVLREHHAAHLSRMAFDKFTSRIEAVRDKEQVDQWLQRMTQVTRYTLKHPKEGEPAQFESLEAARNFLLAQRKEQIVRASNQLRFSGKAVELLPAGPLRSTIEAELSFQRTFPLVTANTLRGRLRKAGFTLYRRGSKGITYVAAVRRKFRTPNTNFADSIQRVLDFIEKHQDVKVADLPEKFLGISPSQPEPLPEEVSPAVEGAPVAAKAPPAADVSVAEAAPIAEAAPVAEAVTAEEVPAVAETPAAEPAPVAEAIAPAPDAEVVLEATAAASPEEQVAEAAPSLVAEEAKPAEK
ncbi:MAG: hypothetical protein LBV54_00940, partial [Puniceicoccales bacterium]|nr:hypothetical protein [Puniceicoccales bacterium]